jgi:endonuclease YncB( thermonuclease family)
MTASPPLDGPPGEVARRRWVGLLLLVPVALSLAVPLYDRGEPALLGVPFFYWAQLALVVVAAGAAGVVYRTVHEGSRR